MNDKDILKKFFGGYVESEENSDYLCLYRFSSAQREFYNNRGDFFGSRSRFQSGVYACIKDCERIAFDFKVFTNSMETVFFEIVKKNGNREQICFAEREARFEMEFSKETVWMYFPYYAEVGIKNIVISGKEIEKSEKKIYCFGDSITQGYFSEHQAISYPQVLGRELGAESFNFGIGGYYFDSGVLGDLNRLEKPHVVTIAYGTNDWHFEMEYVDEMKKTFDKVHEKYKDIPVFVILPAARVTEKEVKKLGTLVDVRGIIKAEAEMYENFNVIDSVCNLDCETMLSEDGVHPNDLGAEFLSECVLKKVRSVLL